MLFDAWDAARDARHERNSQTHPSSACLSRNYNGKTVYWNEEPVKNYYSMFDTVCLHDGDRLKVDASFIYC